MQKTIVGNISSNLSFGYSKEKGMAVVTFSVAVNGKERQGDTWVDKEPVFYHVIANRSLAENTANSLTKGMRVIVSGEYEAAHRYTKADGEPGVRPNQISADAIGPDLRFATAEVSRARRSVGGPEAPQFASSAGMDFGI